MIGDVTMLRNSPGVRDSFSGTRRSAAIRAASQETLLGFFDVRAGRANSRRARCAPLQVRKTRTTQILC